MWEKNSLLDATLSVWSKLLRGTNPDSWAAIIENMENRLASVAFSHLASLSKTIALRIPALKLAGERQESLLAVASGFFERLVDKHLAVLKDPKDQEDGAWTEASQQREVIARDVLLKHWAVLLAHGCTEAESDKLFARCPADLRVKLASVIVREAIGDAKRSQERAIWRQKKPRSGWRHAGGTPVEDLVIGMEVEGVVTNSSSVHGVYINFGCVKDGRLDVPAPDWNQFKVGMQITNMIVKKVDIKDTNQFITLSRLNEVMEGRSPATDVARRAVKWLSSPAELREVHFESLIDLWAKVVALELGADSFEPGLELLGPPLSLAGSAQVVAKLLSCKPTISLARAALSWLSQRCPEEAVGLWQFLFEEGVDLEDVRTLLTLCDTHALEFPTLPEIVVRGLSHEILERLAASNIPEARLLVIQALSDKSLRVEELPEMLQTLCEDSCVIVSIAARNLHTFLLEGGKDEATVADRVSAKEESTSSDSDVFGLFG